MIEIKTKINNALTMLTEMYQASHIREEGNVKYQAIKTELEQALALPDPAPVAAEPTAVDVQLAAMNVKLDTVIAQTAPAPAV